MRLHHLLAPLLIPVVLAGCVAPGPSYGGGGGYYGRPAYGGGYGGYRAPAYGGGYGGYRAPVYGGGYRDQGYARHAPPRNDGGGWGGGQRQQAPQASRGSGSPEIDRAIAIARQRQQPQQNPATQ